MQQKEPEKARHYLDLLDTARCNGQWQEIPELTRKVGKHAPNRQCTEMSLYSISHSELLLTSDTLGLIHTAQTERVVADQASKRAVTPSTSTGLSQAIPPLIDAIKKEKNSREDAFQGQICLAWLYQTIGERKNALSALPTDLDQASDRLTRNGGITARWTHVCIVKGAYIRGPYVAIWRRGCQTDADRGFIGN